jgi:membrane protein
MNFFEQQLQRARHWMQTAETRARAIPGVAVLIEAARAYGEDRCSLLAAALSYYALLSIFPLMLLLLTISSSFIARTDLAIRTVTAFIGGNLPVSAGLLERNLQEVARLRGPLSILASAGFIWSALGVFDTIQLSINRAFRAPRARPIWRQRLFSLGMIAGVSLLFALSLLVTTSLRFAVHYRIVARGNPLADFVSPLVAAMLSAMVFAFLYRYVPYDPSIRWKHVWAGALIAAALWEVAKLGFAWYLTNYALLNLVYGSLGAVIAIMLWGYMTAAILLFGAEVAAVIANARQRERTGKEW